MRAPGFTSGDATVDFALGFHHLLLPGEFYQRIAFTGEVQDGFGLQLEGVFCHGGRWRDRRQDVTTGQPEQEGETAAIGMARGIDAFGIHVIKLLETGEDGIEEFQIPVAMVAQGGLPAGAIAFGIGQLAGGVQTLHVNGDGLGPVAVQGKTVDGVAGTAAVAVEHERKWGGLGAGGRGNINEGRPRHAVEGPLHFLKIGRRHGAGKQPREEQQRDQPKPFFCMNRKTKGIGKMLRAFRCLGQVFFGAGRFYRSILRCIPDNSCG